MLGTYTLALTAGDAVGCFDAGRLHVVPVGELCALGVAVDLVPVHRLKEIRDRDVHRAAGHAVMAGCAGNGLIRVQRFNCLSDHFFFMFGERFEFTHEA